jgi:hypothetical protein
MSSSSRIAGLIGVTLALFAAGAAGLLATDAVADTTPDSAKILSVIHGDTLKVQEISIDGDGMTIVTESGRTISIDLEDLEDSGNVDSVRALIARGNMIISDDGDTVRFRVGDEDRIRVKKGILRIETDGDGDLVRVGDSIEIAEGEVIQGDAVAVGGSVTVAGTVMGDVVGIGGDVRLESTAVVHGETVCVGGKLTREPGAKVSGEVVSIGPNLMLPFFLHDRDHWDHEGREHHKGGLRTASMVFFLIALCMALMTLVLMSLWGSRIQGMAALVPTETLRLGLTGLITWMLAPWTCILLVITCVGAFFVPLFAVLLLFALVSGLVTVYLAAGGWVRRGSISDAGPVRTALVGVVAVHGLSVVGPFIGGFFTFLKPLGIALFVFGLVVLGLAGTIGLGAVLYTRFGKRDIPAAPPAPPVVPPYSAGTAGPDAQPI